MLPGKQSFKPRRTPSSVSAPRRPRLPAAAGPDAELSSAREGPSSSRGHMHQMKIITWGPDPTRGTTPGRSGPTGVPAEKPHVLAYPPRPAALRPRLRLILPDPTAIGVGLSHGSRTPLK